MGFLDAVRAYGAGQVPEDRPVLRHLPWPVLRHLPWPVLRHLPWPVLRHAERNFFVRQHRLFDTPAPQPVAGRRRLPKRCFGSGCARPVATLKGAGEPHRPPALFAGIDAARQRQTDINPFIFMDLSVVVQARYCFGHRNVQENASIRTSRDAPPNALRRTVR